MARRGQDLREHILWTAKDVFLELGFERASMDIVANRAHSSKRSLYAHFGSKEKLFLAIVDLVRGLLLDPLGQPGDHADDPVEALTRFCARYAEAWTVSGAAQMFRLNAAEAARFPAGAAHYYEIAFGEVQARLAAYIVDRMSFMPDEGERAAEAIMAELLYPRLLQAVFGLTPLQPSFGTALPPELDLTPIRRLVVRSTYTGQSGQDRRIL